MTQPQTQAVRSTTVYSQGDIVLYRDAERFWLGKPGHTFVGRVERAWPKGVRKVVYTLTDLSSGYYRYNIDPAYMRLLPATAAMHDIDTAPLSEPDVGAMTPAAVAWLRQHLAAALPTQRT